MTYSLIVHTDETYEYGWSQYDKNYPKIPWIRITKEEHTDRFWFLYPPRIIFDRWGWEHIEDNRYDELQHFMDTWWINGIYYIYNAVDNKPKSFKQIVNWILGPIAELINEWQIDSKNLWNILPPKKLSRLYDMTQKDGFIRSKSKNAIHDLMHGFDLSCIEQDNNYWFDDANDLYAIIEAVYEREKEKILIGDPRKIGNWLVGQIMKETKGQSDPAIVKERVQKLMDGF